MPNNLLNHSIDYKLDKFEGPLDLLLTLIEKNKMNIHDISILDITRQYLDIVQNTSLDFLENSSEFLYMAATLLYIKSKSLLPNTDKDQPEDDLEGDLILKLLAYRRCKFLANNLKLKFEKFSTCYIRDESSPQILDLPLPKIIFPPIKENKFYIALQNLKLRNTTRFSDLTEKMSSILQKDRYPLYISLDKAWQLICQKKRLYFRELLTREANIKEQVSTFLAVLELLRMNHISVFQENLFSALYIEKNEKSDLNSEDILLAINSLKKNENSELIEVSND